MIFVVHCIFNYTERKRYDALSPSLDKKETEKENSEKRWMQSEMKCKERKKEIGTEWEWWKNISHEKCKLITARRKRTILLANKETCVQNSSSQK